MHIEETILIRKKLMKNTENKVTNNMNKGIRKDKGEKMNSDGS